MNRTLRLILVTIAAASAVALSVTVTQWMRDTDGMTMGAP